MFFRFKYNETASHLFLFCPALSFLWNFFSETLGVKGRPGSLKSWWIVWRRKRVNSRNRVLWDIIMMAFIWVVSTGRNERVFNHTAIFILSLLDYVLFLVNFWADIWSCH